MGHALVLDTCGEAGYVAVVPVDEAEMVDRGNVIVGRVLGVRATQEELLPAIEAVLAEAGVQKADLDSVVVVSGPGSFTGVRIGMATAKGLCEATGVPFVTLSRLAVLAGAVEVRPVWAWLQAGRGDVFAQLFEEGACGRDGSAASGADGVSSKGSVYSLQKATAAAGTAAVVVCEDRLRVDAPHALAVSEEDLHRSLRRAAVAAVRADVTEDVALSDAMYLRVPDAELALRAKQA